MASINERLITYDNLTTATHQGIVSGLIDGIFESNPALDKLVESGSIREKTPSGTHYEINYRTGMQDQNIKAFGRGTTWGRGEKETLTVLTYPTKDFGNSVTRFWKDDKINRGPAQVIEYIGEIVENSHESLVDDFATNFLVQHSDPLQITALETLIRETPTTGDAIGGLAPDGNAWMQNQATAFSGTIGTDLITHMVTMWNDCSKLKNIKGRNTPDLILTTQAIHEELEDQAEGLRQLTFNESGPRVHFGMGSLMFKGAEIFWDRNCPSGRMYFLNTKTLRFYYDPSVWFDMTPWKTDQDNLDRSAQILASGELTVLNFPANGVLHSIA